MTEQEMLNIAQKELTRRKKISITKTGRKHTEETRKKMRESQARRFTKMKKTSNPQTGL